jgi:hypothetical protein
VRNGTGPLGLRDRIGEDLKANFTERLLDCVSSDFAPDFIVRDGDRVVVIELKIGDPAFPLPASANVQMLNLKDGALKRGLSQEDRAGISNQLPGRRCRPERTRIRRNKALYH